MRFWKYVFPSYYAYSLDWGSDTTINATGADQSNFVVPFSFLKLEANDPILLHADKISGSAISYLLPAETPVGNVINEFYGFFTFCRFFNF